MDNITDIIIKHSLSIRCLPEKSKHSNCFMCKAVNDTYSTVQWNIKTDNLAPTLKESIELFLSKIN